MLLVRDTAEADWRLLLTIPADDALTSDAIAFSEDGSSLLATSSVGADTGRLVRIDVATGAQEVLAADPEADVSDVRLHPDTREPQIVTFAKDRSEYVVLDPSVAGDLAAIRALHPGDPVFAGADDADGDLAGRLHQRHRPGPVLRLRPGQPDRPLPVRAPARAVALRAGPDGAVLVHRPGRPDRSTAT